MTLHHRTALMLLFAAPLSAQLPELQYTPDLTIELSKDGIRRVSALTVNKRGRMIIYHDIYPGELIAFDSLGRKRKWDIKIGGRKDADIAWVSSIGWVGDSLWVADQAFAQLAVLDSNGKLLKSIERPSWVRPFWGDRRKYPVFSSMAWRALYADGTMLVTPLQPRALFDTPEYDRNMMYLLRVNADGKILRTVARLPARDTRLRLRDGTERKDINVPFFVRTSWQVSADGQRIAIVRPLTTASDSGAFLVTMLNADGDTLFTRRYTVETKRVNAEAVANSLAAVQPFGRYTAEWIRDTLRKQIPVFESRVIGVDIGVDYSTWVRLRTSVPEQRQFVIDADGDPVGFVTFPQAWRLGGLSVDRVWTAQREGPPNNPRSASLVRLKRATVTAVRPSRSAPASASPRRSKAPE